MNTNRVQILAGLVNQLPPNDQGFAKSMIEQSKNRPLSAKQMVWVDKLIERASNPSPKAQVLDADSVKSLVDLINRNNKAKWPKIRVLVGTVVLQISRAGANARVPGSLNIVNLCDAKEVDRASHEKEWLGRIHLDGHTDIGHKEKLIGIVAGRVRRMGRGK